MISKHITCKAENDNYRRLANYIADASHKGEKCLLSWVAGAWNSDDYNLAIEEVEATQELNTRTKKEKTYHLLISFRMEDEDKLTSDDFKSIEKRFAEILGFTEHQRHCGVHINTDNIHMHIAYNMIHIDKLTRHEPFQDYKSRDILCRQLEREYGLSIDNGIDPLDDSPKLSQGSATKESLTGEESFERFVMGKHDEIIEQLENLNSWEEVHQVFGQYGLEIKPRANGLSIKNKEGKQSLKASKFNRELSYKKMTERFGNYQASNQDIKAKDWYKRKPLAIDYKSLLWREFVQTTKLEEINKIKQKWFKEELRLSGLAVSKRTQFELLKQVKIKKQLEINELRQNLTVDSSNWQDFLIKKATEGNEEALEVLRKQNSPTHKKLDLRAKGTVLNSLKQSHENWSTKKEISSLDFTSKSKNILFAVADMKASTELDFIYKITPNGAILFTFSDGAKVIDYGRKVTTTKNAKDIGKQYEIMRGIRMEDRSHKEVNLDLGR